MYYLHDPLKKVRGVGQVIAQKLAQQDLISIQDLLLYLPLNYADLSQIVTIDQLQPGQNFTIQATVDTVTEFFKNGKRLTKAVISDETGRTSCMWFNNRFIKQQLKKGENYFFAGPFSNYHNFSQPKVEAIKAETIHTGRLVPRYSQTVQIPQGKMRLILKEIIENLAEVSDLLTKEFKLLPLRQTLSQLHFPDEQQLVIEARKRLAIEELLTLMQQSAQIKQAWQKQQAVVSLNKNKLNAVTIPQNFPFQLTQDQTQAVADIVCDLTKQQPMNRLLIGDVGSGKTVVAGIAALHILQAGFNVALIAPTQILAKQHLDTFHSLFPQLKTTLLTGQTNSKQKKQTNITNNKNEATLFIGTHAVINQLELIKPGLVIYDEQHRFGVAQRTTGIQTNSQQQPHILTMSATPIPRSYMLTIFSHLQVSLINEFPFGEKQIKTWYVPKTKKQAAYDWLAEQIINEDAHDKKLALIICPFINPSKSPEFVDVPAATEVFKQLQHKWGKKMKVELLHGQQKPEEQEKIITNLFGQKIDVLVATTVVEVGVDLPQANIMLIEGADRFGLASLHQLRGRVGRQSQASFCLVFSSSASQASQHRLQLFSQENNGLKLAELDLATRGPGDLFGLEQHGLDNLRFASWTNIKLIAQAQQIFNKITTDHIDWQPLFHLEAEAHVTSNISHN